MKLRDFQSKPKKTARSNKIVINNDAAELKYKAEIAELNSQLGHYRRIEAERDDAVSKFNAIEDNLKLERVEADKNREKIHELEKNLSILQTEVETIPDLKEQYLAAKGSASVKENELQTLRSKTVSQSQEVNLLRQQLENFQQSNNELEKQTKEAVSLKQSTEVDFEQVSNKNKELKSFADETSKINKELIEKNKSFIDLVTYYEVENKELNVQLEEIKSIEAKLRDWISNMEIESTNTHKSKNTLETKISKQADIITDMSNTLDDMMKELSYVRQLNKAYRDELSKPTYTSMAAIASQEGFVMPNGKENVRTHNLGNYKPTLLKFKKQEVANGR
jgi:chromosome segregation ATPase|tara:strand:- start:268 stop:1275 length:1008 start_codon:yes stop_codon:yes gene_type:complete